MKIRSDFVSNSSSSSFIIRKDQDCGIFRNDGLEITWQELVDKYECLRNDCRYLLQYGYCHDYWDDGWDKLTEEEKNDPNIKLQGKFTKLLSEIVVFLPDSKYIELWKNSKNDDIEKVFPECCKDLILSILPQCQELANLEVHWFSSNSEKEWEEWKQKKDDLFKIISSTLNKVEWKYKELLEQECKDMKFLIASYSDHEPGWDNYDDAETAMINGLLKSNCKFQRIFSQH